MIGPGSAVRHTGDGSGEARVYAAARQDKPWGHEIVFADGEGGYVGKVITVTAGEALSLQYHQQKDETVSVLVGRALIEYGRDEARLASATFVAGDTIHLPSGVRHRITALDDLVLVEASTAGHGWRTDVVRLEDRYGRSGTTAP